MIFTAEEFVALRLSDSPELYQRAANDSAPESVWLDLITNYPDMKKWVAHNKTVPISILRVLATDSDPDVRIAVAMKRKCEVAIFEKLANDINPSVRLAVAYNAKTPTDILRKLTRDDWDRVATVAKSRLNKE